MTPIFSQTSLRRIGSLATLMCAATTANPKLSSSLNVLEGRLVVTTAFFNVKKPTTPIKANWQPMQHDLKRGFPGGVLTTDGQFTIILADGRLLARLGKKMTATENRIRIIGTNHDAGKAITPRRIEYYSSGSWRVFDLPFSGSVQRGVATGDE